MLRTVCERFSAGTVVFFFELMSPIVLLFKFSASDSVARLWPPAGFLIIVTASPPPLSRLDLFFFNFRGTSLMVVLIGDMLVARVCLLVSAGWRYRVC